MDMNSGANLESIKWIQIMLRWRVGGIFFGVFAVCGVRQKWRSRECIDPTIELLFMILRLQNDVREQCGKDEKMMISAKIANVSCSFRRAATHHSECGVLLRDGCGFWCCCILQ